MERFWIFKRGSINYLEDTATHKQESLRTKDKRKAERIRAAKNEAVQHSGSAQNDNIQNFKIRKSLGVIGVIGPLTRVGLLIDLGKR